MIRSTRYLIFALPMVLVAACSQSTDQLAVSATSPVAEATAPLVATTSPAPAGTSTLMVSTPLPVRVDWNNLSSHVGKYQDQIDLFEHGPISVAMRQLLGDKYAALRTNLQMGGPLQKDGNVYYLTGNAPHQGGIDQAYVLIDPAHQAVEVGLWQAGEFREWKTPEAAISKPIDVQRMIDNVANPSASAPGAPGAPPEAMPSR